MHLNMARFTQGDLFTVHTLLDMHEEVFRFPRLQFSYMMDLDIINGVAKITLSLQISPPSTDPIAKFLD